MVVSTTELAMADGETAPVIYVALQGLVYDVSERIDLYGPEGHYKVFAGKDVTRAFARMSLKAEECNRRDVDDFEAIHRKTLRDWVKKYGERYKVVGEYSPSHACIADLSVEDTPEELEASTQRAMAELLGQAKQDTAAKNRAGMLSELSRANDHANERASERTESGPPSSESPSSDISGALEIPGDIEVVSRSPRVLRQRHFLQRDDCRQLREMLMSLQKGSVFNAKLRGGLHVKDPRWTEKQRLLLVEIEERLGALMRCGPHPDEDALMGTLTPGDEGQSGAHLGVHVDTNAAEYRYATAIIYLSTVPRESGGRTLFCPDGTSGARLLAAGVEHTDKIDESSPPELQAAKEAVITATEWTPLAMEPEEGMVCAFWTRQADGTIDPLSWHAGEATKTAWKWTLQKFKEIPVEHRRSQATIAAFSESTLRLSV